LAEHDDEIQANRPYAAAVLRARQLAGVSLTEFAERLSKAGSPASRDQASRWERGVTVVPAHVLLAAAQVADVDIAELLGMMDESTRRRLEELEQRMGEAETSVKAHGVLLAIISRIPIVRKAISDSQATEDQVTG
jgi:transcriptional regulator with XRE-family HTH domain